MSSHRMGGAAAPGRITPTEAESDDARGLGSSAGTEGNGKEIDRANCAVPVTVDKAGDDAKRLAGLRARLALHGGHVVHELAAGGFLVIWRGLSRECRDLAELEAHARRVGAMR
ncbi:hypothetical protein [Silanimonas sp.]|jgi:hypothetical protein|uniref:hypothetical protein n=1 Tax=Silanimonas sp. TaxID=1929290 RepID=UPI0022BF46F2|nr:hypothetical protein [Silanimonas sp.]MCZ8165771.1 hypothetical protein [Silanimonas sp.]